MMQARQMPETRIWKKGTVWYCGEDWNMAYHESMYFLVFLPVVFIGYQLAPKRVRFGVLLFFSYCFYFLFSHRLIVYLLGATTITYLTGRLVATGEKNAEKRF